MLYTFFQKNKILVFIITILVITGFFFILLPLTNPDNKYTDPFNGETTYNPKDRTPEKYNQPYVATFLGFDELTNRGVSFGIVQSLKTKLSSSYIDKERFTEVSIDTRSIEHSVGEVDTYTFISKINRKHIFNTKLSLENDTIKELSFSGDGASKIHTTTP